MSSVVPRIKIIGEGIRVDFIGVAIVPSHIAAAWRAVRRLLHVRLLVARLLITAGSVVSRTFRLQELYAVRNDLGHIHTSAVGIIVIARLDASFHAHERSLMQILRHQIRYLIPGDTADEIRIRLSL